MVRGKGTTKNSGVRLRTDNRCRGCDSDPHHNLRQLLRATVALGAAKRGNNGRPGTSTVRFSAGYWQQQVKAKNPVFSAQRLDCYLKIVDFVRNLFNAARDASTIQKAFNVLKADEGTSAIEQFDRQLLAALLNFANGEPDYNELVDTDANSIGDTPFLVVLANAESVRLNPASTKEQIVGQKNILERINLGTA